MNIIKFFFLLIIALIIAVFGAHNSELVPISLYPFNIEISVAAFVLFFGFLLLGAILAGLVTGIKLLHWRKLVKAKSREIARLEKENTELRAAKINQHLLG